MMDINADMIHWPIDFLIKSFQWSNQTEKEIKFQTNSKLKNYTSHLLEKLRKEKQTQLILTIFGGTNLANMQLISKFNNGICFLFYVIDTFSKYAWVIPLSDKKRYYNY